MKKTPAPKRPTMAKINRMLEIKDLKSDLAKEKDALDREEKLIKQSLFDFVKATAGIGKLVEFGKKVKVSISQSAGRVKWKDEFIRVAGSEAAEKAAADLPKVESLKITIAKS